MTPRTSRLTDEQIGHLTVVGITSYLALREQGRTHEEALDVAEEEAAESARAWREGDEW